MRDVATYILFGIDLLSDLCFFKIIIYVYMVCFFYAIEYDFDNKHRYVRDILLDLCVRVS